MSSVAGPEANPVAMIQEGLGIPEDAAISIASIRLRCPGRDEEASLGDFIASSHGAEQGVSGILNDIATEVKSEGVSHDEAVVNVLGKRAVIRDEETGELARVTPPESKKK